MGRVAGNFDNQFAFRDTSGLTYAQSKSLNLRQEDDLCYSVGTQVANYKYKNFNPHQYTFACRVQYYTTGDTQYILDYYGNSDNYISAYLTNGTFYLKHKAGGSEVSTNLTPTIVAGTLYNLIFRGKSYGTIDGGCTLKIDFGTTSEITTGTTSALGTFSAADTTFSIGQNWQNNGTYCMDGRLWLQIEDYAWTDSEVTSFFNSGVPTEPIVDTCSKFMFAGELSNGLPQGICYDSFGSAHYEDFEDGITDWNGNDATIAEETTTPVRDLKSIKITATGSGGGYGYYSYAAVGNTTYLLEIIIKGTVEQTGGIQVNGNVSGVLTTDIFSFGSTEDIRRIIFTTGASDTAIEIRLEEITDISLWSGDYTTWISDSSLWSA